MGLQSAPIVRLVSSPATMGLKGVSRVGKADIWQQRGLILKMNVCPVKAGNMEIETEQAYAQTVPSVNTIQERVPPLPGPVKSAGQVRISILREAQYAENAPPEHTGLRSVPSQPPHAHAVPQEPMTQIEVVHQSLPVLNALQVSMVHPKAPRCH